jgi:diadenosine tetraphosphate (Ap4A) HIT family hydrolase
MSCPFCDDDLAERIFFKRDGWFAFLDANPLLLGHTILAREAGGCCPNSLTSTALTGVHNVLPVVASALKESYSAYDVLVTSLRGTVKHMHFHLVPLVVDKERAWRSETLWEEGHLHEYLGHHERERSIRDQRERIDRGWTEARQRDEHCKELVSEVARLKRAIAAVTAA